LRRDDWDRHAEYALWKDDYLSAFWGIQGNTGTAVASLQAIEQHSYTASATLGDMLTDMRSAGPSTASFMSQVTQLLHSMAGKLDIIAAGSQMTMNLYGTDPSLVAGKIGMQMRLQGASS